MSQNGLILWVFHLYSVSSGARAGDGFELGTALEELVYKSFVIKLFR